MKAPWYETSSGATAALLASRQWVDCDLYTITTVGSGPVLRYATGTVDVVVPGGNTWSSKAALFDQAGQRPTAHWKVGLDVDQWQVLVAPRPVDPASGEAFPDKIGSLPWLQAARAGALDGAEVQVDRAFFSAWPTDGRLVANPVGIVTVFFGRMAEVDVGRSLCVLTVNSHVELLQLAVPINLYQAACVHTLFDAGCTLLASNFAVNGTVTSASGNTVSSSVAAPGGSGTYALGRMVMTSGQNEGFSRMVRAWTPGAFTLLNPFPFALAAGDTFTAYPGCDKTLAACDLFANRVNYGGVPFIPAPETAV